MSIKRFLNHLFESAASIQEETPAQLSWADRNTIELFARTGLGKDEAFEAYRRNFKRMPSSESDHLRFMAEIDNSCPDLLLRHELRRKIVG